MRDFTDEQLDLLERILDAPTRNKAKEVLYNFFPARNALEECKDFLQDVLTDADGDGWVSYKKIIKQVRGEWSDRTVQRAGLSLGIRKKRLGRQVLWSLRKLSVVALRDVGNTPRK